MSTPMEPPEVHVALRLAGELAARPGLPPRDRVRALLASLCDLLQADIGLWAAMDGPADRPRIRDTAHQLWCGAPAGQAPALGIPDRGGAAPSHLRAWLLRSRALPPPLRRTARATRARPPAMPPSPLAHARSPLIEAFGPGIAGVHHAVAFGRWTPPAFSPADRRLLHVAHVAMDWLHTGPAPHPGRHPAVLMGLTARQRRVLCRLLAGRSEAQAAADLGLSLAALRADTRAVYRHLGVADRSGLLTRLGPPAPGPAGH